MTSPEQRIPEKSYLDGILSTHFDECSIAAADAARSAAEFVESQSRVNRSYEVQPIGRLEHNGTQTFTIGKLAKADVEHALIADNEVMFSIARDDHVPEAPASLVAVFNHDLMLPIATFEPRTDGQCSYVQIGQEIDEDKLVATEERSSRMDTVEDIRRLIKEDQVSESIIELVRAEADEYYPEILSSLESACVRAARRYLEESTLEKGRKDISVVNEETAEVEQLHNFKHIRVPFFSVESGNELNGHGVGLLLGQAVVDSEYENVQRRFLRRDLVSVEEVTEPAGPLQLLFVTRGNVALCLGEFDEEKGVVTFGDGQLEHDSSKLIGLLGFFSGSQQGHEFTEKLKDNYDKLFFHSVPDEEDVAFNPAPVSFTLGRPGRDSRGYERDHVFLKAREAGSWDEFIESAADEISNERRSRASKEEHDNAIRLLRQRNDRKQRTMIAGLDVSERFGEILDHGSSEHEEFIYDAVNVLDKDTELSLQGVLSDRAVGKTKSDIDTTVNLRRVGDKLQVLIEGRPTSLEGFQPAVLFSETFFLARKNSDNVDTEKVKEMHAVLREIAKQNNSKR
ncbi:MAG: hypothetical protein U5L95_03720 [Candidatus Saccharibacteria bacterium]|nr:hypothetical protein [Candidatus Saccharibacteria bacterium]